MRISHRHKFIFFANPKTGSTSVRELLDPLSDISGVPLAKISEGNPFYTHMRPLETRDIFRAKGWVFEDYRRFTFVRNPWRRLASVYEMLCATYPNYKTPFPDWLRKSKVEGDGGGGGLQREPWLRYGTYSLANFAGDGSGRLLVDDVFRTEDIDTVPMQLAERGIPVPTDARVPRRNVSRPAVPHLMRYSPDLVELVRRRYADEIERFGYSFD